MSNVAPSFQLKKAVTMPAKKMITPIIFIIYFIFMVKKMTEFPCFYFFTKENFAQHRA